MESLKELWSSPMFLFFVNLFVIFIVKVIDNILGTSKTILIQKNKGFLAAITVVISQIIFYELIDAVSSSDSNLTMYVIAVASGFGTYLAVKLNDKFSKERTFVNVILSDNREAMEDLRDYLREHKITNLATEAFTKEWEKTIAITAYAETKEESKLLDEYIAKSETKFKRLITKE